MTHQVMYDVKRDDYVCAPVYHGHSWKRHEIRDDRFFELVKLLSVQMADRCQDGLLGPEQFAKTVVAIAANVMQEFLYMTGERKRPPSQEEQRQMLDEIAKTLKVPAESIK